MLRTSFFFNRRCEIKLADFGLARRYEAENEGYASVPFKPERFEIFWHTSGQRESSYLSFVKVKFLKHKKW